MHQLYRRIWYDRYRDPAERILERKKARPLAEGARKERSYGPRASIRTRRRKRSESPAIRLVGGAASAPTLPPWLPSRYPELKDPFYHAAVRLYTKSGDRVGASRRLTC